MIHKKDTQDTNRLWLSSKISLQSTIAENIHQTPTMDNKQTVLEDKLKKDKKKYQSY